MMSRQGMLRLGAHLALKDLRRDARMAACLILGVAAVVSPLLVLFGLRYGVIQSVTATLKRNPTTLELRPLNQGAFDESFFAQLRAQPGVTYLEPTPRYLATILTLTSEHQPGGSDPATLDMLPSRSGDPLLTGIAIQSPGDGLVLSQLAAEKLAVKAGDRVTALFGRVYHENHERLERNLVVRAVLPLERLNREAALADPQLVLASEDFLEGLASPYLGTKGDPRVPGNRRYAGFRLFARDIDAVEPLRKWLVARNVTVDTSAAEIQLVRQLDHALGLLFLLIAVLGCVGGMLGLAVSLWASVERKRHELGVMRLIGFRSAALAAFPVFQALIVGLIGTTLSVCLALPAGPAVQRLMVGTLAEGLVAYRLPLWALGDCMLAVLLACMLSAGAAATIAASLDPADTLRKV